MGEYIRGRKPVEMKGIFFFGGADPITLVWSFCSSLPRLISVRSSRSRMEPPCTLGVSRLGCDKAVGR